MVREVRVRGIRTIRLHVSGDHYSAEYAEKWLRIMRRLPRVRFWMYSRSWRIPEIEAVLRQMALLDNCTVWYSLDVDTGFPAERPPRVKYAFMQTTPEGVQNVDLIFRTRNMVNAPRAEKAVDYLKEKTGIGTPKEGTDVGVSGIKERMDVIASCGKKVGVVDHVEGGYIKLTKNDSPDGQHLFIPFGWVKRVDGHVHLIKNSMETERDWAPASASCCTAG